MPRLNGREDLKLNLELCFYFSTFYHHKKFIEQFKRRNKIVTVKSKFLCRSRESNPSLSAGEAEAIVMSYQDEY